MAPSREANGRKFIPSPEQERFNELLEKLKTRYLDCDFFDWDSMLGHLLQGYSGPEQDDYKWMLRFFQRTEHVFSAAAREDAKNYPHIPHLLVKVIDMMGLYCEGMQKEEERRKLASREIQSIRLL